MQTGWIMSNWLQDQIYNYNCLFNKTLKVNQSLSVNALEINTHSEFSISEEECKQISVKANLFPIWVVYSDINWDILCFMNCILPGFWQRMLINVNTKILCANNGLWYYLIASPSLPVTRQTLSQRETRRLWDVIKHSVLIFTGLIGTMNSSVWKLWITFCSLVLFYCNAEELSWWQYHYCTMVNLCNL